MDTIDVSLSSFMDWYKLNEKELLEDAIKWNKHNQKLKAEFLAEWPLERLDKLTINEYVQGKGSTNKSFCYELEHGKYKIMDLGIGGGTAGKFGMYFSQKDQAYRNQNNEVIPSEQVNDYFEKLKKDLVSIVTSGIKHDFSEMKQPYNLFYGKTALIIKLLCAYSDTPVFFGVNNGKNEKKVWDKLVKKDDQGGVYKQNYDICKLILDNIIGLDGELLTPILWRYQNYVLNGEEPSINKYSNYLIESKNIILHGAPGTGKTYLAREIAADIVSDGAIKKYSDLSLEEKAQIEFVQFHPNYDYTDFVEGLRPIINEDGTMVFKLQQGIFSNFVALANKNYKNSLKTKEVLSNEKYAKNSVDDFFSNIDLESNEFHLLGGNKFSIIKIQDMRVELSIPGNSIVKSLTLNLNELLKMMESGKDFKQVKDVTGFFNKQRPIQEFSYYLALFKEIKFAHKNMNLEEVTVEKEMKYVFIIDEINRGEISKIFGELFFSIDPGYRGEEGAITTQYANLHQDSSEKFYIPNNVYIIGTMNDIDRSVDTFDFAMRRRFRFINIKANERISMLKELENREDAIDRMKALNKAISAIEELNDNYHIGAAYFLKLEEVSFEKLWDDYLEPLLCDYVRGLYNEDEIMESFKKAYNLGNGDFNENTE